MPYGGVFEARKIDKMTDSNQKYITVSFVLAGAIAAYIAKILLESLASTWGLAARYVQGDLIIHGVPVTVGLIVFLIFQFNSKSVKWADEVLVEIKKVVWPSRKDTVLTSVVVTFMLLISGVLLGAFDLVSNYLMKYIIEL